MRQFSNVLYIVPDTEPQSGLERAIALTKRSGATLTLVSIVETMVSGTSSGRFHDELAEAFEALRSKRLKALQQLAKTVPADIETVCEVMDGLAYLEVIKRVQLYQHDLVVANVAQSGGIYNRLFVSEEMQLLRKCPCPVLLLKRSDSEKFSRVLASIDFDHEDDPDAKARKAALNDNIVDMAATIADQDEADLDIVNIFTVPGEGAMVAGWIPMTPENLSEYANRCREAAEERLDGVKADSQKRMGLPLFATDKVQTHIVKGRARAEIPRLVKENNIDLVVMGTVGRVGVPGFLIGNTAETILGAIDCSVLALKPDGFVSPVTLD